MSLMRRVKEISVATLNDRLERSEDPVRLIDRYLAEQADNIRQTEKLHQQCAHHASQLHMQCSHSEQLMNKREEQAALALKAGEEHLARLALQEKLLHEEKYLQYKPLYDQAQATVDEVAKQMAQMRADYNEIYNKRQFYLARMESVRLQQQMNERLGFNNQSGGDRAFSRLEDRVSDMELEARSLGEIRRKGQELLYDVGTTAKHALDSELQRLKRKLEQQGGSQQ